MDVPEGVFVLFTASQGQTSLDTVSAEDRNANSVFMRSLLPLLKMPGLTQIDLAKMVQERVSSIAAAAGQEQKPVYVDRFSDLVILNNGGGETPAQGKAQTENPAFALEEWKIVKDSGNRSVLEGFKAKYGSDPVWGPLVDQALLRLEEKPKRVATLPSTSGDDDFENKPLYRDLQTELRRVGCYNGAIDGTWGLSSRRALAQFARRQSQSVLPDENGLEILLASNSGICSRSAVSGSQKNVSKARPRSTVTVRRRAARPSRSCWSCTTYSYTTERICVASGVGNPAMRISHLIRCRRG